MTAAATAAGAKVSLALIARIDSMTGMTPIAVTECELRLLGSGCQPGEAVHP